MQEKQIMEAVELCQRNGVEVSVDHVAVNMRVAPQDLAELMDAGLRTRIRRTLQRHGYFVTDMRLHARTQLRDARLTDLRAGLKVKRQSSRYDQNQIAALEMLVDFLEAKERELGYEPYVGLFEDDARRIFAMHGLDLPNQ